MQHFGIGQLGSAQCSHDAAHSSTCALVAVVVAIDVLAEVAIVADGTADAIAVLGVELAGWHLAQCSFEYVHSWPSVQHFALAQPGAAQCSHGAMQDLADVGANVVTEVVLVATMVATGVTAGLGVECETENLATLL